MRKIIFIVSLTLTLAFIHLVHAQQPGKIYRIGILDPAASSNAVLMAAFRQELSRLGWNEGNNFTIEYLEYKGPDRLPELAGDLARLKVDLILVSGAQPASTAKSATTTIPIVMTNVVDPVAGGLIASLARPGGNVTGVSGLAELATKRLEILKDVVPKLVRVGVLRLPVTNLATDLQLKELRPAAQALKIKLEEIETQADSKSIEDAFQSAKQKQVGAIMTVAVRSFFAARKPFVELAGKYRLPAIYPWRECVDEGGLMSYGADYEDMFRRSAHYVDKILKGAKAGDLPVQQATKFEFVINLNAAKQIGLTLSPDLLARANKVIKDAPR